MELHGEDVPDGHRGGELTPVVDASHHYVRVGRLRAKRVHEVVQLARPELREHRVLAAIAHFVPTDVRHAQPRSARIALREARDAAGQHPEPRRHAVLVAFVEEELEAEAQAQIGTAGSDRIAHCLAESFFGEARRRRREGADAGKHHAVRLPHFRRSLVTSGTRPERASAFATLRRFPAP
jgi:hypothetical protein